MRIPDVEKIAWASSWILWCALASVLYSRRLHNLMPMFFSWACLLCAETTVLFLINQLGQTHAYYSAFWLFAFLDFCLQLAVAVEFAHKALKRGQVWICDGRVPFVLSVVCSVAISMVLAVLSTPAAPYLDDVAYARLSLFSSLSVFFVGFASLSFAYRYGAVWQRRDSYRFAGFLVWSAISALIDTMHVYWRTRWQYEHIDQFHMFFSQGIVAYWILTAHLSSPSPEVTQKVSQNKEALRYLQTLSRGDYFDGKTDL